MLGAMFGDIVGSVYEFDNIKTKDFPLFRSDCFFTDDSVMTAAVAEALLASDAREDMETFKAVLVRTMHRYGEAYPDAGYGGRFSLWLAQKSDAPYHSLGNGSAMRVSPVAWYARSLAEALTLAEATASVTHNHPEGIKGAACTAGAVFLARTGASREEIRSFIEEYYTMDFTLDEIRPRYTFNETCEDTVPEALMAFLESESFEDAIRLAVSLGGDSDTLAAITGSVAEAYYGMTEAEREKVFFFLDEELADITRIFAKKYMDA